MVSKLLEFSIFILSKILIDSGRLLYLDLSLVPAQLASYFIGLPLLAPIYDRVQDTFFFPE